MRINHASRGAKLLGLAARIALVVLVASVPLRADLIIHKFELWGTMDATQKLIFYEGWTNGFFVARGNSGLELAGCLVNMSSEQAIAMIDQRYKTIQRNGQTQLLWRYSKL